MNNRGIDTTENCAPHIEVIKAAGFTFVARYYSHSPWKNVQRHEALALTQAGIYLVGVWESAGDHAGFFSYAQGINDGHAAHSYARMIGQPADTPIYFAVDADLPCHPDNDADKGAWAYFRGVNSSMDSQVEEHRYRVGVYGSGLVCRVLKDGGRVSYTWLAQSMGWSESRIYHDWNLRQGNETVVAGMRVDTDMAAPKGGGGFLVSL